VVERLLLLAEGSVDFEEVQLVLPASRMSASADTGSSTTKPGTGPLAQRVLAFERAAVLSELAQHGRNITQTARALGLERSHLYKKCQQLGINLQDIPDNA
jgi:two-component system nitrogen regulation response regulator NtrX